MSSSTRALGLLGLVCISVLCLGCSGPIEVKEGQAGYENGQVQAPAANLLSAGEHGEGIVDVDGNALVGVEQDGELFFYHPSQGVVELSEESSRYAIGRWLAHLDPSGKVISSLTQGLTIVTAGDSGKTSTVGVKIEAPQVGVGTLKVTNTTRRWTAVIGDQDETAYYLVPRGNNGVPTNVVSSFLADVGAEAAATNTRNDIPVKMFGEVFGAVTRGLPLILASPSKLESAIQARVANKALFTNLNVLDFYFVLLEGTRAIAGAMAINCLDVLVHVKLMNELDKFIAHALEHKDPGLTRSLHVEAMKEVTNSFLQCAGTAAGAAIAGPFGALAVELLSAFFNIINVLNWAFDDVVYTVVETAFGTTSYEEFALGEDRDECCFIQCGDGKNNSGAGIPAGLYTCVDRAGPFCADLGVERVGTVKCDDCGTSECFAKWKRVAYQ